MWIQQVFVACLCVFLGLQQITAVVNSGQKSGLESLVTNGTTHNSSVNDSSTSSSVSSVTDSVAESSEQKLNRRETPVGLSDSYGAPIPSNSYGLPHQDSYLPSLPSNLGLPVPVYGVPDAPSNNLIYPAPPADIPPPISNLPGAYGPPKDLYGPPEISLPPPNYGPPFLSRPQKPINLPFNLPKPIYGPPSFGPPPRPLKPVHLPLKLPKPQYGPPLKLPKPHYGPPKPVYLPSKPLNAYGPPVKFFNPPKDIYGPPKNIYGPPNSLFGVSPALNYGPPQPIPHGPPQPIPHGPSQLTPHGLPQPIPHGPPHPGAPAPPTPPDIKYDGWQPIPGLVSRPPSGTYEVHQEQLHGVNDLHFNTDFVPPPQGGHGSGLGGGHGSGLGGGYISGLGGGHGSGFGGGHGSGFGGGHGAGLGGGHGSGLGGGHGSGLGGGHISGLGGGHGSGLGGGHGAGFGGGHGSGLGGGHGSGLGGGHGAGLGGGHGSGLGGGHGLGGNLKGSSGLSDSYGAPLNTVTGSGGIISTSGDSHGHRGFGHNSGGIPLGIGSGGNHGGNGLSVVKSIGYEILPTGIQALGGGGGLLGDSYSSPPLNSYSLNGPYAAAHSYKLNEISSISSLDNFANLVPSFEATIGGGTGGFGDNFSSGFGLIPPSGVYGVPPSGHYGTPLLQPPNKHGGPSLNINPPKHPVVFREPVPSGLIESIGSSVAQKDAHGIIDNAYSNNFAGPAYVPPPVPDVNTKPVKEEEPVGPSTLYSLPSKSPTSFQSYAHGSSSAGLNNAFGNSFNFNGATAAALTSYTAPLRTVDGSYGLPQTNNFAVGLANSQPAPEHLGGNDFGATHEFAASNNFASTVSGGYGGPYFGNYQNTGHDCSQNSQPLPPLSFGVPAANSYTASLASLNTNIAGAYHVPPAESYGVSDLQTAHSQSTGSVSETNSNNLEEKEQQAEVNGKSLAENFAPGSELVKSESIDLNNIPLRGSLGSYTLQIQSANGASGVPGIPHDQVLNDGLLQSILNAIEQPQQNTAAILGQPLLHLQQVPAPLQQIVPSSAEQIYGSSEDSDAQHSVTKNVVVTPPPLETPLADTEEPESTRIKQAESDKETSLPVIDSNEIALYFSNNAEAQSGQGGSNDNTKENKGVEGSNVRNGQQYGSYVSFRTPNTSFAYGDLKPTNVTLQEDATTSAKTKT